MHLLYEFKRNRWHSNHSNSRLLCLYHPDSRWTNDLTLESWRQYHYRSYAIRSQTFNRLKTIKRIQERSVVIPSLHVDLHHIRMLHFPMYHRACSLERRNCCFLNGNCSTPRNHSNISDPPIRLNKRNRIPNHRTSAILRNIHIIRNSNIIA